MFVVYKYPMTDVFERVPSGVVRHIAAQSASDPLPTIWVEHAYQPNRLIDSLKPSEGWEIKLVGTGHAFDDDGWEFVQTAVCLNGALVFHCYQRPL